MKIALTIFMALALGAQVWAQPSPDAEIDRFFQSFTEKLLRLDPEAATKAKFFPAEEQLRLDGMLTESSREHTRRQLDVIGGALRDLRRFDRSRLSPSRRVAASALSWSLEDLLRAKRYLGPAHVFTQNQNSAHSRFVTLMLQTHSVRTPDDARTYLARLRQAGKAADQWIEQARAAGAKSGLPPVFLLEQARKEVLAFIESAPEDNMLVTSLRDRLKTADRAGFADQARAAVSEAVYPAWRKIAAFLESQGSRATNIAGMWNRPDGLAAYASLLRMHTNTDLSPDAIHRLGLAEVARIEREIDTVLQNMGLVEGSVAERYRQLGRRPDVLYLDTPDVRDRVLADYREFIRTAEARVSSAFRLPDLQPVEARRIPAFREAGATATYVPAPADGSQPAIFLVPLRGPVFSRLGMRTLAHHEAIPGHHFQVLYRSQQKDAPAFRRFSLGAVGGRSLTASTAYDEGWGLYAEQLAAEMGLYEGDDIGRLGFLQSELFRAARLVVDTGLHAKRWTREQAIAYMQAREPRPGMSTAEVDRYIAGPGQACAYKIGQLKILELREKAKQAMGEKFDLKDFHAVVLGSGSLPLPVLEELVDEYIHSGKRK